MFGLILIVCLVATQGKPLLNFQGHRFKRDTEILSRGCYDVKFNKVFRALADNLLGLLESLDIAGIWTGQKNFTQTHLESHVNSKPYLARFTNDIRGRIESSSLAFGFRASEERAVLGNFS
ncbi:hypothetical protein DSO57_1038717 [Entomophthora muscae]|uniref:Uncharacterized protein n=1 Tax=Entomophthora muscae TaxID=34485 RepID=A0ACC2UJD1_9FUNG|nr:hypothetical protein DSO57_1038717 [Entomophthora muscae]